MTTKFDTVAVTLAAAFGLGATFTVNYPAGKSAGDYLGAGDHRITSTTFNEMFAKRGEFSIRFGASNIVVTNSSPYAMTSGTRLWLHLDRAEADDLVSEDMANPSRMAAMIPVKIELGAPAAASANAIVLSQAATAANGLATGINGALAAAGRAVLDVPRNVVAAWTGTAILTVTGEDEYGNPMRESSASGASFAGRKAFKVVTGISVSADVTGLTVGTGVLLGLPMVLERAANVIAQVMDGATATAGTIAVADLTAPATATTGDVRGTYSPNSAPNGTRAYELVALVQSVGAKGQPQFAG